MAVIVVSGNRFDYTRRDRFGFGRLFSTHLWAGFCLQVECRGCDLGVPRTLTDSYVRFSEVVGAQMAVSMGSVAESLKELSSTAANLDVAFLWGAPVDDRTATRAPIDFTVEDETWRAEHPERSVLPEIVHVKSASARSPPGYGCFERVTGSC